MKTLLTAVALTLATAPAIARDSTIQAETISGIRYHTVATDASFNRDNARKEAWAKAVNECDIRGGYMTEFHAGATTTIIGMPYGTRQEAYATCRTDQPAARGEGIIFDDALPAASVTGAPRLTVSATGSQRGAYLAVRNKAVAHCATRGEHVEQLGIGMSKELQRDGVYSVTAHLACAPAM
ncbi:hypothetical protein [Luteibacter sp.]|uniref:hypothetical protein n=1 Tax=Luteibacter sp. TaxID=1886636 RepID=UPI003F7E00D1